MKKTRLHIVGEQLKTVRNSTKKWADMSKSAFKSFVDKGIISLADN